MESERVSQQVVLFLCLLAIVALLVSVGGCSLFRGSRVEARADYNVVAQDCSVSLVAVGYFGEGR